MSQNVGKRPSGWALTPILVLVIFRLGHVRYCYTPVFSRSCILLHNMIGYWHHREIHLSVCLQRYTLWLSGSVYMAKSCTGGFIVGCRMYSLATKRRENKNRRKREREFFLRHTIRHALVVLRSVIHWLRELLNFGLSRSMVTLK